MYTTLLLEGQSDSAKLSYVFYDIGRKTARYFRNFKTTSYLEIIVNSMMFTIQILNPSLVSSLMQYSASKIFDKLGVPLQKLLHIGLSAAKKYETYQKKLEYLKFPPKLNPIAVFICAGIGIYIGYKIHKKLSTAKYKSLPTSNPFFIISAIVLLINILLAVLTIIIVYTIVRTAGEVLDAEALSKRAKKSKVYAALYKAYTSAIEAAPELA
ncbi:hypothetical protein D6792_01170, partial [Candidatus Parcubacteria bacterium]